MTDLYSIQPFYCVVLLIMLFIGLLSESALLIFRINRHAQRGECSVPTALAAILTAFVFLFPPHDSTTVPPIGIPYICAVITICLTYCHLMFALVHERKKMTANINPDSIREAINNISTGVCFSDPNGRIILCNKMMRELTYEMIGSYPQTISEIDEAFYYDKSTERQLSTELFYFPDGRIREFVFKHIVVNDESGWRQIIAKDVTDLCRVKEQLERENKRLAQTNQKLNVMFEHITDAVREKESLEMKIRVHDTMGRSLITIQDLMKNPYEAEKKLDVLCKTVNMLSESDDYGYDSVYDEINNCEKLGIKLNIDGRIPNNAVVEKLIVTAIRECATNCVKHAHGHYLNVNIQKIYRLYSITLTNDGEKPKEMIKEGSGLSSLRRSVEAVGGEMLTAYKPRFALLLNLPTEENDV